MDESTDSGRIKGLPAGWIDGFVCARRLLAGLRTEYANADPAPWYTVVNPDYWGLHFGKSPEEYVLNEKLAARLVATFQRAVISGELVPSWFDGSAFKRIPPHAFGNSRIVNGALVYGGFEVDPLWPDEWQVWSGHGWAIPKDQFEQWMQCEDALSVAGLPMTASEMPPCDVASIGSRKPSESSRVALSEAVTWIAFGIALDAERLDRAIGWERLAHGDLQAAQRQMEAAADTLLKTGADGLVPMYGRHIEAHGEKGKRTEKIDPLTLDDYRKALIFSHDNLYYGAGLMLWFRAPKESHMRGSERSDHFINVTVDREALLKRCGSGLDSMAALLMPIPASLPQVGAVMDLAEAVCLLAFGRPSHDIELWIDRTGNMMFRDPSGAPLPNVTEVEMPPHLVAFIEANRQLWRALQDGSLRGLVAPTDGPALSVPRIYWNPINRECLESVYQGTSNSDAGRGCPVLLSRQAFDAWRAATSVSPKPNNEKKPKTERKRPGPAPDPDWPLAIAKVTQDCIAAGYKRALKRGHKAAIQTMLLNVMAEKNKHFSDDIAAKHAEKVIAALPDY